MNNDEGTEIGGNVDGSTIVTGTDNLIDNTINIQAQQVVIIHQRPFAGQSSRQPGPSKEPSGSNGASPRGPVVQDDQEQNIKKPVSSKGLYGLKAASSKVVDKDNKGPTKHFFMLGGTLIPIALAAVIVMAVALVLYSVINTGLLSGSVPTEASISNFVTHQRLDEACIVFTVRYSNGHTSNILDDCALGSAVTEALVLQPGEKVILEATVRINQQEFPQDLVYQYTALKGEIPKNIPSYTAPVNSKEDMITLSILDPLNSKEIKRNIRVIIR